jgi:hypothetical protein
MVANTLGEVARSLEAATAQLTRVADALSGVAQQAAPQAPMVNIWGDDPFSDANPTANPPLRQAMAVPLKGLDNQNLRVAIAGAVPPIGQHAAGTDAFLYWNAAEALSRGIALWSELLPQGTTWSAPNPLPVQLVAPGDVLNAFYGRDGLRFFRGTAGGTQIFTALSGDVVCHELGHAILDALKPQLFHAALPEASAFHEAFGDISALLSALELDWLCEAVLRETGGRLSASSRLSRVAESLGWAIRQTRPQAVDVDCLRNAANRFGYPRQPGLLPTDAAANQLSRAPHSFSRIFTGAFFDILAGMFGAGGAQDTARLRQVSREAGRLLVAAVHTAPIAADYYSQVAAAMIQSDEALNGGRNRQVLSRAFAQRDILSVPSVMRLATPAAPIPQVAGRPAFGMAGLDLGMLQLGAGEPETAYRQPAGETPELPVQGIMMDGVQIDVHLPVAPPRFAVAPAAFGAVPEEALSSEMAGRLFVEELIQNGRVEQLSSGGPTALRGIVPEAKAEPPTRVTHTLVTEDGKSKLRRLRFQCCPGCQRLSCSRVS